MGVERQTSVLIGITQSTRGKDLNKSAKCQSGSPILTLKEFLNAWSR